jgi:hypothetical protein
MADIRVERKAGTKAWLWVLLALVVLALALFLLYQAGYLNLALRGDTTDLSRTPLAERAFSAASHLQEVFHG